MIKNLADNFMNAFIYSQANMENASIKPHLPNHLSHNNYCYFISLMKTPF